MKRFYSGKIVRREDTLINQFCLALREKEFWDKLLRLDKRLFLDAAMGLGRILASVFIKVRSSALTLGCTSVSRFVSENSLFLLVDSCRIDTTLPGWFWRVNRPAQLVMWLVELNAWWTITIWPSWLDRAYESAGARKSLYVLGRVVKILWMLISL